MVWANYLAYWNGYQNTLCGPNEHNWWNEQTIDIDIEIPHLSPNAIITIGNSLGNVTDASWGVRQWNLYSAKCTENCANCTTTAVNACLRCYN